MALSIEQAETNLKAANSAYREYMEADSQRSGGGEVQEGRRETHELHLLDEIDKCEQALKLAQKG